jgi:hypothetical protein
MSNLKSFVRLDFKTVKPYFTLKNLLIYAAVDVFLSVFSGTVQMSIGIGFMLGTLFIGYPFAVGEKCNMDALYVTLSLNKGMVVRGRYLFILVMNLFAVLGSFVCATFGLFVTRMFGAFQSENGGNDPLALILVMSAIMIVIQVIQLPLYFKMGYTKAKFLSILPFAALFAGFSAFMSVSRDTPGKLAGLWDFLANIAKNGMIAPLAVLALALVIGLSYSLSLMFYKKRDF